MSLRTLDSSLRAFALSGVAMACGSEPPPAKAPKLCSVDRVEVGIRGGERLNPDESGSGLPVQVRLYQLDGESSLATAFFSDVWSGDEEALGETLVAKTQLTVYPSAFESLTWPLESSTRVVAAVALFREPRARDWTVSFDVRAGESPCPAALPRVAIWADQMKIRDGSGRPELEAFVARGAREAATNPSHGEEP